MFFLGICLLLLPYTPTTLAWGADGHHITCLLAESLLLPSAEKAVVSLLPEYAQGSLTSLCTWPDDVKWQWKYQWTSPLHYVDTPDFLCNYNYDRDCHNEKGTQDICVSGGINNYTEQLTSYPAMLSRLPTTVRNLQEAGATQYNLTEALLFLAHFVGDIHQPLHVGFTSDMGGNTISVHWYTRKYNLHHIWDTEIINSIKAQYYDSDILKMAYALHQNITGAWKDDVLKWAMCEGNSLACPDTYAKESIALACKYAYRNATPGSVLEDEYYYSRLPIVQQRLAQGGVRLAAILNALFSA
eukprot:TRINITY_DN1567_c0_g1_i1.p1 TRINITY_DN1567_c0_g1~~TRINITY_DN1567_c0_g1_i1.p1  ORF type:complete len:300 (+),score=38.33 TRINITY_DN1567_c0_g1_i1:356-1255(+)